MTYQNFLDLHEFCQNIRLLAMQQLEQSEYLRPEVYCNCTKRKLVPHLIDTKTINNIMVAIIHTHFFCTREFFISKQASASLFP